MATDTSVTKAYEAGAISDLVQANNVGQSAAASNNAAVAEVTRRRTKYVIVWPLLAAEAMASTATDVTCWRTPDAGAWRLKRARYSPQSGGLTADNTNFSTATIKWNDDAGGGLTTVASIATTIVAPGSGNWTANRTVNFIVSAVSDVPAASAVHFVTTKSGTGVVTPSGILLLDFEEV